MHLEIIKNRNRRFVSIRDHRQCRRIRTVKNFIGQFTGVTALLKSAGTIAADDSRFDGRFGTAEDRTVRCMKQCFEILAGRKPSGDILPPAHIQDDRIVRQCLNGLQQLRLCNISQQVLLQERIIPA